jgi:hypothetical protein
MRELLVALSASLLLTPAFTYSQQAATTPKDIFLKQKGCPLDSAMPVTGSGYVLKNIGTKTITGYTLEDENGSWFRSLLEASRALRI